jgi:predicted nucleic acid-binding protein
MDAGKTAAQLSYNLRLTGLVLVSRNTKDFKSIQGLEVIDPYGL